MIKRFNDFIKEDVNRDIFSMKFEPVESADEYCSECGGDGKLDCSECDGGEIYCQECDGNGYIEEYENEYGDCSYCDGSGRLKCDECDGNKSEYDDTRGVTDLSLELEYKLRTLPDDSEYDFDQFFEEFGVKNPSDFAVAAILKGKEEYKNMSDDEFFDLYKNSKE